MAKQIYVFLPKFLEGKHGLPGSFVQVYPSNDYQRQFHSLGRLIGTAQVDVVLIVTPQKLPSIRVPCVTMVQNIEPLQHPEYATSLLWRVRLWLHRREYRAACLAAKRVIALSNHVRNRIIEVCRLQPSKVDLVYHGFSTSESAESLEYPMGFLFSAGIIAPYRGTEDIIQAIALLRNRGVVVPPMIIAGGSAPLSRFYERRLKRMAVRLGVYDQVHWIGQLSEAQMSWCYQNCGTFIFTSRAEACPNIVLESMGHGCISVSCDHEPMPELYGDSALFYRCGDANSLAQRISQTLAMHERERQSWRDKGLMRIHNFTWEQAAAETLMSLERALS